jgi:hypothetical protein
MLKQILRWGNGGLTSRLNLAIHDKILLAGSVHLLAWVLSWAAAPSS